MKARIAYCKLHKRPFSRQIKRHGCMDSRKQHGRKQQCNHFVKNNHPAWEEKRKRRTRKKGAAI